MRYAVRLDPSITNFYSRGIEKLLYITNHNSYFYLKHKAGPAT